MSLYPGNYHCILPDSHHCAVSAKRMKSVTACNKLATASVLLCSLQPDLAKIHFSRATSGHLGLVSKRWHVQVWTSVRTPGGVRDSAGIRAPWCGGPQCQPQLRSCWSKRRKCRRFQSPQRLPCLGLRGTHLSQCCGWRAADGTFLGGFSPGLSLEGPQKHSGLRSGRQGG